ncbi:GtrA family protein [Terasakiella sp. SH-1]|uniref:GtrA family protein n=1 Tax=Terasakiella sp. SH-1 TaxID=2560057 RepID=UPI0014318788|nr:GtrA family protein [Terasakiella sp. SH-1]
MRTKETRRQLLGFLVTGGLAFMLDGGILQALVTGLEMSPFTARSISFSIAVVFTWLMNRKISFKVSTPLSFKEFFGYLSTQSFGLSINVGVYTAVIFTVELAQTYPFFALIPATALSMVFNFVAMKYLVFKKLPEKTH